MKQIVLVLFFIFFALSGFSQTFINYAEGKPVNTSWDLKKKQKITDASLVSGAVRKNPRGKNCWIDIDLTAEFKLGGIHLYLDNAGILPLRQFSFQYQQNGQWKDIKSTDVDDNFKSQLEFRFFEPISATAIRFNATSETVFGVNEIQVWGADVPELPHSIALKKKEEFKTNQHWVCVNQVAYNLNAPKRFTVPTAKSNLPFHIIEKESNKIVYYGQLNNSVGDFSNFIPKESEEKEYVISVEGDNLKKGQSYPFIIRKSAIQKMAYQPAVDFFVDARSIMGSHPSAYGGTAWRDGTYYTVEVPSIVMLYLSNPKVFKEMPVTINWNKEKAKVNSPDFEIIPEFGDDDPLSVVKKLYNTVPLPKKEKTPDLLQCLQFGVSWDLVDPVSADPSGDLLGHKMHSQTIEKFAYFLYGYPAYKEHISEKLYDMVLDSTLVWWDEAKLFDIKTTVGNPKGRHCPGHSIMPNLLMYEVAKRGKLSSPEKFLEAAQKQTSWIIKNADWNNPAFTKGQRMSEQKLILGLAHFMKSYPEHAPNGLYKKIEDWAQKTVDLSNNMWDFRKFSKDCWTLPGYNEAGNIIAFPACAFSVAMILKDQQLKKRIVELAYSHFDNFNGRNPVNAHCANHPENGFIGVDKGWPYGDPRRDICARLEHVRGSLSSLPGSEMYPFNPNGRPRHGEGWTTYNANWNFSLCYLNIFENIKGEFPEIIK